ncbi:hypothetical protein CHGG_09979 [Chaetomium globosum CBS 148.51]|uniref:NodB homology domain-containing protein n=1 Tax=Chaetomium globosum (strain ATCC 6205 / CBS 148.51 / DSM 1962 / NBRC 6347 / NRRL 1970) TaxID=306901 RepID=Q2GPX5_CHAGB|nr:uncharacterized protein CHGG_09979 [Chaetomium globosum CBS 148.51]EAQ83575.1 hypothetical protein CHGG_09979 [Chaetomium globosum CBS 148.51]
MNPKPPPPPPPPRWPAPYSAAISFTMDNLGEAQDVLKGAWPHPIGTHPAVTDQLPRMLALLDRHGVRATYFAEAWSLARVPGRRAGAGPARGMRVAWHGFQHEVWRGLDEARERESFERSCRGGGGVGGAAVDAFCYMEKFGGIRKEYGEREEVLSPEELKQCLMDKIDDTVKTGGFMSILFHPSLQTSEEKFEVMQDVLKRISEDGEIWVAPCKEVAEWMKEHPEVFEAKDSV